MKKILLLVLGLSTLQSFAQKVANPQAYAKTITADDLRKHLFIIASKEMEGRETATPGQKRAAAYIETQFKQLGLQPGNNGSYQQYYDVLQDSLTDASFEVNGQSYKLDQDYNVGPSTIAATMRFSEVVFVGANTADSLKNANLAGKLVLLMGAAPAGRGQAAGIYGQLLSKGVAGILSV